MDRKIQSGSLPKKYVMGLDFHIVVIIPFLYFQYFNQFF